MLYLKCSFEAGLAVSRHIDFTYNTMWQPSSKFVTLREHKCSECDLLLGLPSLLSRVSTVPLYC